MSKKYIIFFSLLLLAMLVSGCVRIPSANNKNLNQGTSKQPEATTTVTVMKDEIKYLPNGEIDMSGWKTYRSDYYKMNIKYPPFLSVGVGSGEMEDALIFDYKNDWNYICDFGKYLIFKDKNINNVEDKKREIKEDYGKKIGFMEIKVKNGFVYYFIDKSLGGYEPTMIAFSNKNSTEAMSGIKEIYSQSPNFPEYDPKYIKIFKTMLQTIEFDN
jgi:hypothetical protein